MKWTKDGDKFVASSGFGDSRPYCITPMTVKGEKIFAVRCGRYDVGEFTSLENAKHAAENYDGYRAGKTA